MGGTTIPGAVPTGSITVAPSGTSACLRLEARTASKSRLRQRFISGSRMSAIRCSSASSNASGRPAKRATTSSVRSSAVGPNPPLVTIRPTPSSARKRSWASMSCGRSPQMVMWARSTPISRRRSESHGPLRSRTLPVSTSVPVTTMPARTLIRTGSRARSTSERDLGGPLGREVEAHRVGAGRDLDGLSVQTQVHSPLPEVEPHALSVLERPGSFEGALEDNGGALARVDAYIRRLGRRHADCDPPGSGWRRGLGLRPGTRSRGGMGALVPGAIRGRVVVLAGDEPQNQQEPHEGHHERYEHRALARRSARCPAPTGGRRAPRTREGLDLLGGLVVGAVLLDEHM